MLARHMRRDRPNGHVVATGTAEVNLRTVRRILALAFGLAVPGCADHASSDGGTDVAFLVRPDVAYEDAGRCIVTDSGAYWWVWDYTSAIACDSEGWNLCANAADETLPGWQVIAACSSELGSCVRGERCPVRIDGCGSDAGALSHYCCGDGPACGPNHSCARPFGSDASFACVCSVFP